MSEEIKGDYAMRDLEVRDLKLPSFRGATEAVNEDNDVSQTAVGIVNFCGLEVEVRHLPRLWSFSKATYVGIAARIL